MRILLAEDDPSIGILLRDRFTLAGHEVSLVTDGDAAWSLAASGKSTFELAVLDVMLPKVNGWELCRRLKARPETASVPVIILTAKGASGDELLSYEAGADEYLVKPFDFNLLLEAAERLTMR